MNIAIVAATPGEILPTQEYLTERLYLKKNSRIEFIVTGVGLMNTTYTLAKSFSQKKPDIAIQAGVAGTMHPFYPPGMVTIVKEEILGDLGVEEDGKLRDIFDLELAEADIFPFSQKMLINPHRQILGKSHLLQVKAISVNEITTSSNRVHQLIEKYGPVLESMEGAAFHYVCLQESIPFIQLRAVSNLIGERDKSKWQMKEAIENLNRELILLINNFLG